MDLFGAPIERGIIASITEAGARVASTDRPGIVTMPLKAKFRKAMEVKWPVFFLEYEDGSGVVLCHQNPEITRDDSPQGADGKSAYDIWLEEGHAGTVEDYLASLVGPPGQDGANGQDGINGQDGEPGPAGPAGPVGPPGSDATVTKPAVEGVLTGNITSHNHTLQHIGAAPTTHNHTKSQITDFPTTMKADGGNADTLTNSRNLTVGKTAKAFNGSANIAWALGEILDATDGLSITGNVLKALGIYEYATTANGWRIKIGNSAGGIMIQAKRVGLTTSFSVWDTHTFYVDINMGSWDTAFAALWSIIGGVSDLLQMWPSGAATGVSATAAGTWRLLSGNTGSRTGVINVFAIGTY